MKKKRQKKNYNLFYIGLISGISLIVFIGILLAGLILSNDNSYFARIRVAIKKKVQIVYNQNLFDGNKIDNSGIKEYDSDKQEITFDGKLEGNHINLGTLNVKLKKGERYRVTINYLSGSYDKEGEPKFIFELQKDNEYYTDRKNGTHYVFEMLPTKKDTPIDKVLTIKDEVVDATNILYRIYQENEVEFNNYKIQISITKLESKIGVAGEKYGKLPTPEKDGYEFLGWYDSISGGKKITETNTILKKYNHPLYAHWNKNENPEVDSEYLIKDEDFLKVNGTKFVKKNNDGIVLRGFNLGEYLSRAISLMPINNAYKEYPNLEYNSAYYREYADNNVQINYILTKRFGKEKTFELNETYYNNFISSYDIVRLAEMGVNVVRVPLEWSFFVDMDFIVPNQDIIPQKPTDMDVYNYTYKMYNGDKLEKRLEHLDWVVSECRKKGIYVIFDLHVVDGGQNNGGIRSLRKPYSFFKDKNAQSNAIEILKIVANRFNNNPGVAAFELLNEPGSKYRKELINFYDNAYSEIRKIDKEHIIIMESAMTGALNHQIYKDNQITLPNAEERKNGINDLEMCPITKCKWTNVAYSVHDYFEETEDIITIKKAIKDKVIENVKDMKKYNVPIFIGEVNFNNSNINSVWPYAVSLYDNYLFSYTFWTYKAAKNPKFGMIYLLNSKNNPESVAQLLTDDYKTIKNKFSLSTEEAKYDNRTEFEKIITNTFVTKSNKPLINSSKYECNPGTIINSTIKIFSKDGSVKLQSITSSNSNIMEVNVIPSTGVVCTSSSCKTISISCKKAGKATITATASNGQKTTAEVNVISK